MTLKHLLILIPGFPKDEDDSTCLPAVQQFLLCYRREFPGVKISVVTLHYPFHNFFYQWNGIDVYPINGRNRSGFKRVIIMSRALLEARRINKINKVDIALSFWLTDAALAGKLIASFLKIPHFVWMQGQDAREGNKYVRLVRPDVENLAALSEYHNEVLHKNYGIRATYVIENGINEAIFPILNRGNRKIDLFAAGSLISLKQYHIFLEIVKHAKEHGYPQIKAELAGDGILRNDLNVLIKEYKLNDNVKLLGSIPHTAILDKMNNSRVFIHPSSYESQSTVVLEALYSGCSVLSFLPISKQKISGFNQCVDIAAMKKMTLSLLNSDLSFERVKYHDMVSSAMQTHEILNSLLH